MNILTAEGMYCGYSSRDVVRDAGITLASGEIVGLLGSNGSGKTTLLRGLYGLIPLRAGRVTLHGEEVRRPRPHLMKRKRVALCPQGACVFAALTVHDHVKLASSLSRTRRSLDECTNEVLGLFPELDGRLEDKASVLSGGERQMLSLAVAMICDPAVALLDEPLLGLPDAVASRISARIRSLARAGVSFLIVEHQMAVALDLCQRVYVLRDGQVSFEGRPQDLSNEKWLEMVLG